MPRSLSLQNHYPVNADRLFELVTDLDTLEAVTRPWVQFDHLPSGQVRQGQVINVAMSVLGLFPTLPYRMEVAEFDPVARRMTSVETGSGVRRLIHTLEVTPDGEGSCLHDRIEIDAGWKTGLIMLWAWWTYRWRHHLRLRLLKESDAP